jgi:hypothetical protein
LLALLLPPEPASATAGSFNSTNINISSSVAVPAFFIVLSLRRPRSVGRSVGHCLARTLLFLSVPVVVGDGGGGKAKWNTYM